MCSISLLTSHFSPPHLFHHTIFTFLHNTADSTAKSNVSYPSLLALPNLISSSHFPSLPFYILLNHRPVLLSFSQDPMMLNKFNMILNNIFLRQVMQSYSTPPLGTMALQQVSIDRWLFLTTEVSKDLVA